MRLIDDDGVIGFQQGVALRLSQQNTIGHEFDRGVGAELIVESHLVAHHFTRWGVELLGDALGHRGRRNAPGLGVANELALFSRRGIHATTPQTQGHFGQLCGFSGTGLATHNHHRMVLDGTHDLLFTKGDGQGGWIIEFEGQNVELRRRQSSGKLVKIQ